MIHARVGKVIFGAAEPRTGALGGAFNLLEANEHNHFFEVESGCDGRGESGFVAEFFSVTSEVVGYFLLVPSPSGRRLG